MKGEVMCFELNCLIIHMHNNILVAAVQSGSCSLRCGETVYDLINEVIKKCLFIQSKCQHLEFVAGNPRVSSAGTAFLRTRTLHVHLLSDQVLIRAFAGWVAGSCEFCSTKVKQGTLLLRKLPIKPGGEIWIGAGDGRQGVLEPLGGPGPSSQAHLPPVLITARRAPGRQRCSPLTLWTREREALGRGALLAGAFLPGRPVPFRSPPPGVGLPPGSFLPGVSF